jgi:hypothetical protein
MKKYHFIALAVCCGFLWACQKDGPTENPFANAPWAIDETLPVPILVSAPDQATKSDAITSLADVSLKVIAYDQSVGEESLLFGKELDAVGVGEGSALSPGSIQFKEGGQNVTYYYPMSSVSSARYNYTFFAYHIPEGDYPGGFDNSGHYVVSFPLDPSTVAGNQDILVASAAATNYELTSDLLNDDLSVRYEANTNPGYPGFNARYQRITYLDGYRNEGGDAAAKAVAGQANMEANQPKLYFSHCTARIILKAMATDQHAEDSFTGSGLEIRLTSILQANARENVKLDVSAALALNSSNYDAPDVTVLTWDTSSNEVTTPYEMTSTVAPAVQPVVAGELMHADDCLYIVPGTDSFTIGYEISHNSLDEPATFTKTIEAPTGGFLPGRTYTYNLKVDSNEAIHLSAYLGAWGTGGSEDIDALD